MSTVQMLDLRHDSDSALLLESLAVLERYFAAVALLVAQDAARRIDQEIMEMKGQDASSATA